MGGFLFGFPVEEIRIGNSLFADVTDEVSALIEGASPETLLKVSVDARQLHAIPWLERQGFELGVLPCVADHIFARRAHAKACAPCLAV